MSTSQTPWARVLILALVGLLLGVGIYYSPAYFIKKEEAPPEKLRASGTSVVYIMAENNWRREYRLAMAGKGQPVDLVYDSVGTTGGIDALADKKVPLAFLHAPLSDKDRQRVTEAGGEVVQIPVLVCAVVPVFNVPELQPVLQDKAGEKGKTLVFSGEVLSDIFRGKITKWNDEALKKLQDPAVAALLPDRALYPIRRDDSSGTTQLFTEFLGQASEEWKKAFGAAGRSTVDWPAGVAVTRSSGMIDCVRKTKGALGYADLVNVRQAELPDSKLYYGAVRNRKDKALLADPGNMTAAIKEALPKLTDSPDFRLTYQEGDDSYPLTGLIWAVCYRKQSDADRKKVVDFLDWVVHDGQKSAGKLAYAPLPPELVKSAEQKLQSLGAH